MTTRQQRLAPCGIPRWIRVYDNQGETIDRYTVVFTGLYKDRPKHGDHAYIGLSDNPNSPRGFCMSGTTDIMEGKKPGQWPPAIGRRGNLGLRIPFQDLPLACQEIVWEYYACLWEIKVPRIRNKSFFYLTID